MLSTTHWLNVSFAKVMLSINSHRERGREGGGGGREGERGREREGGRERGGEEEGRKEGSVCVLRHSNTSDRKVVYRVLTENADIG